MRLSGETDETILSDGEPAAGVLKIPAIFLKAECTVVVTKEIDTTITVRCFDGLQNDRPIRHRLKMYVRKEFRRLGHRLHRR